MPLRRPTTTPLPDEIYDEWAPQLREAELKVLLYVVRRTLGFRKSADAISLSQFTRGIVTADGRVLDHGCGVRNRSNVVRALKNLETKGLIRAVPGLTASGDQSVTTYALLWEGDEVTAAREPGGPDTGPRGSATTEPGWSFSEQKVVLQEDHGSAAAGPTTNSTPTNSQQNSETTRGSPSPSTRPIPDVPGCGQPAFEPAAAGAALWQALLEAIRPLLPAGGYAMWFSESRVLREAPGALTVGVANQMQRHYLDVRLRRFIERTLGDIGQGEVSIDFEVIGS